METAIVSIICVALVIFGGMTMTHGFLTSVDSTTGGLEEMVNHTEQLMRTELSSVSAVLNSPSQLVIRLSNDGQTKLANYEKWDVIIHYYGDDENKYIRWIPYTSSSPGNNEWTKAAIYMNGQPEVFEPDILNPDEEIVIQIMLDPPVGTETTNRVVISTDNGVSLPVVFQGPPAE